MEKQRVEELLRLYFSDTEEKALMSPNRESQLKAHLKDLAQKEQASIRMRFRKSVLMATAGILALLSMVLFPESKPWEVTWIKDVDSINRGDLDTLYYLKIKPPVDGFLQILLMDPTKGGHFIFPYLDEDGPDYFGLSGPFFKNKETRVPPQEYQGYAIPKHSLLYLILSESKLEKERLHGLIRDLANTKDLQRQIKRWLQEHYAGAFLIKSITME